MSQRTFVLFAVIAAAVVAPMAVAAPKPALSVVTTKPLVVVGTGFPARESVKLVALTPSGPRTVQVRAGTHGGFRVAFRLPSQPCSTPYAVRARSASGKVAIVWFDTPPCTPPAVD